MPQTRVRSVGRQSISIVADRSGVIATVAEQLVTLQADRSDVEWTVSRRDRVRSLKR